MNSKRGSRMAATNVKSKSAACISASTNHNGEVEKLVDFTKVLAIVKKNWLVMREDKLRLVMLMVFPLIMILLFGYTSGASPKHIAAAIVDYDNSQYSQQLATSLYANQLFSIKRQLGSQDEGRRLIESGDIKILFIIPSGFQADIEAGRTAEISIIVDESDPSVAQITRASTTVVIQQLSQQVTASRVAAISAKARQTGIALKQGQVAVGSALRRDNIPTVARIEANFRDAKYAYSGTDRMLSSTVLSLQNSVGYLIDQYGAASAYDEDPGASEPSAVITLLAVGDSQQSALKQISMYQGLQGSNARLMRDSAAIYSGARTLESGTLADKQALAASYGLIGYAGGKMEEISADAQKATVPAFSLSEIEPYGSGRPGLDFLLPSILALIVFQGAVMGLGRAIAGERRDGSLTRVFLTPTSNVTIISGTMLFYLVLETVRSSIIVLAGMLIFGVLIKGSLLDIFIIIAIYAAGATGLGMIMSVLSRSQEQYMALSMLVSLPSMLLAGVFLPVETMPPVLQSFTRVLPITYAAEALRGIMIKGFTLGQVVPDLAFLAIFAGMTVALSVLLFQRELI